MKFIKTNVNFLSKDGETKINSVIWKPMDKEVLAVLQICHGMCEYTEQYSEFAQTFADMGILVCGIDFLGHGMSVRNSEHLGYFAKRDGWKILIEDTNKLTDMMKKSYPKVPYFVLGHSMGSFAARIFAAEYGYKIDGLLLSGTRDRIPVIDFGIFLAEAQKLVYGDMYRSLFLNKITVASFARRIKNKKTNSDWLSTDIEQVNKRRVDKLSRFVFTSSAFSDLFRMIKLCNSKKVISRMPKNLPVYIFSGKNDPISDFGRGIINLERIYKKQGIKNVYVKLYENGRHCMLLEKNRDEVYEGIYRFLIICGLKLNR